MKKNIIINGISYEGEERIIAGFPAVIYDSVLKGVKDFYFDDKKEISSYALGSGGYVTDFWGMEINDSSTKWTLYESYIFEKKITSICNTLISLIQVDLSTKKVDEKTFNQLLKELVEEETLTFQKIIFKEFFKFLNPKRYLGNAFSLQMLDLCSTQTVEVKPVTVEFATDFAKSAESCVGHPDTAAVISSQLGVNVLCQRVNVSLREKGDQMLVGQLTGGRLPEGATTIPEGFTIQYALVTIH